MPRLGEDEAPDRQSHSVMDRTAIARELAASGFDGSYEHLSQGEEQRIRLLQHTANTSLTRRHLIGSEAMLTRVAALDLTAPNFSAVTRLAREAVALSRTGGAPIRLPPLLMVGSPGIGKSRYVRALAQALGTVVEEINGATLPDLGSLTGYPPAWRGAGVGRIAKALLAADTSAPLVFVDECEKINDAERRQAPLDALLPLLEPHTAAAYLDEHLRVPLRADRALWILACNSLDGLSEPLLDRVVTVHVPDLGAAARDVILEAMLAEAGRAAGVAVHFADPAALLSLRRVSLRRARLALDLAIARVVTANRRFITEADVQASMTLLAARNDRHPVGFVHLRG